MDHMIFIMCFILRTAREELLDHIQKHSVSHCMTGRDPSINLSVFATQKKKIKD